MLGRYLFSLYIPTFSDKVIARRKKEKLRYVGKKLDRRLWQTRLFVFLYTLSPRSTTALCTAAASTKVPVTHLIPPFLAGKFISDAAMVMAGLYAARERYSARQTQPRAARRVASGRTPGST
jgi:hypothetical protein